MCPPTVYVYHNGPCIPQQSMCTPTACVHPSSLSAPQKSMCAPTVYAQANTCNKHQGKLADPLLLQALNRAGSVRWLACPGPKRICADLKNITHNSQLMTKFAIPFIVTPT